MPKLADWVKETVSGTPGTGTITLGGAATGFCRFQDQFTTGDKVKYIIEDGNNKEEGIGTLTSGTPWTLARTVVQQTIDAGVFDNTSPAALSLTSSAVVGIAGSADTVGLVVGTGYAELITAVQTGGTAMTLLTYPQNTEGTEILTLNYTPKFADSKLQISARIQNSLNTGSIWCISALFKDTGANALRAAGTYNQDTTIVFEHNIYHEEVSGSTAARTYKLRVGTTSADPSYVNGRALNSLIFSGAVSTYLKVTEIRQ